MRVCCSAILSHAKSPGVSDCDDSLSSEAVRVDAGKIAEPSCLYQGNALVEQGSDDE